MQFISGFIWIIHGPIFGTSFCYHKGGHPFDFYILGCGWGLKEYAKSVSKSQEIEK